MHVGVGRAHRYSISWKLYRKLQRKGWFSCSSILRSLMIFRTLSERTTVSRQSLHVRPRSLSPKSSPSSLRIYFRAKVRPVSLRSTILTFPKAPFPTTRSSRKWLRLTAQRNRISRSNGIQRTRFGSARKKV